MKYNPWEVRLNQTSENLEKSQNWENSEEKWNLEILWVFPIFSNFKFNPTLCGLNLKSHKVTLYEPMWSQIDGRWDLMSHQSEIILSLIFTL